jgi:phosphate transport system substrate-binding protein
VDLVRKKRLGAASAVGTLALTLAACGGGNGGDAGDGGDGGAGLSGTLAGAGSSAQEAAMRAWIVGFNETNPEVVVSYDAVGSGGGREQFVSGAVSFAGSDAALDEEELSGAQERCAGGEVIELPLYVSPIAVVYNLPDVEAENLQMSAATIANIFNGTITNWNDPAIAAENPDVTLPDLAITPVHRSDESGTTENFAEYLQLASGGAWSHEATGDWPIEGGQSGQGTSGVIGVVEAAEGAIGYADASRAGELGTVALKVGEEYVSVSPEAAAAVIDASPAAEDASETRLTIDIARDTTEANTYPLVLVSYEIACQTYEDANEAELVKAFLTYVASEEGQQRASDPSVAGSAPISEDTRAEVQAVLDTISAG